MPPAQQAGEDAAEDVQAERSVELDLAHDLLGLGDAALRVVPGGHRQQAHDEPHRRTGDERAGPEAAHEGHGHAAQVLQGHRPGGRTVARGGEGSGELGRGDPGPVGGPSPPQRDRHAEQQEQAHHRHEHHTHMMLLSGLRSSPAGWRSAARRSYTLAS
jgi:hypothetical protein